MAWLRVGWYISSSFIIRWFVPRIHLCTPGIMSGLLLCCRFSARHYDLSNHAIPLNLWKSIGKIWIPNPSRQTKRHTWDDLRCHPSTRVNLFLSVPCPFRNQGRFSFFRSSLMIYLFVEITSYTIWLSFSWTIPTNFSIGFPVLPNCHADPFFRKIV